MQRQAGRKICGRFCGVSGACLSSPDGCVCPEMRCESRYGQTEVRRQASSRKRLVVGGAHGTWRLVARWPDNERLRLGRIFGWGDGGTKPGTGRGVYGCAAIDFVSRILGDGRVLSLSVCSRPCWWMQVTGKLLSSADQPTRAALAFPGADPSCRWPHPWCPLDPVKLCLRRSGIKFNWQLVRTVRCPCNRELSGSPGRDCAGYLRGCGAPARMCDWASTGRRAKRSSGPRRRSGSPWAMKSSAEQEGRRC